MLGILVVYARKYGCKRSTSKRKGNDSYQHGKNAKDLLSLGANADISIPNCGDRRHREVDRGEVLLSIWHQEYVSFHPSSFGFWVELSCHNPHAGNDMDKDEERHDET